MNDEKKDGLTPGAKLAWMLLFAVVAGAVTTLLSAYMLHVGLGSAESFGVPSVSYGTSLGLMIGIISIGWGLGLGAASWRGKSTPPAVTIVNTIRKDDA